jgi:predicted nucleotidyltransferase
LESLKTILYFSLFRYPLTMEEVCNFSVSKDCPQIAAELETLVKQQIIFKIDEFYLSENDPESIQKRKNGNKMAIGALIKAKQKAAFIAKFPFVEAVGVSGSLSKGYYDNESDIDFFVITKPEKIWICRSLLMLYKKIFLLNSRKFFCINYFLSSGSLEIEEKNRFTATEIKTLIPLQGKDVFKEFYQKNKWVGEVLGEFNPQFEKTENIQKPRFTRFSEYILNTGVGNVLDNMFKSTTVYFWKIKFREMSGEEFKIALKSTKNISKHHPLNFQKKVITSLNHKYEEIRLKHNIELPKEYV